MVQQVVTPFLYIEPVATSHPCTMTIKYAYQGSQWGDYVSCRTLRKGAGANGYIC